MLKVFIADDSVVVRGKLREALEEQGSIRVVGESANAEQAITEIRRLDAQVVIIDIRIPGGGGLPLLKDLKTRIPDRIAIILTSFPYSPYREIYVAAAACSGSSWNRNGRRSPDARSRECGLAAQLGKHAVVTIDA
jgi:two-component system invasion response regulator UvrY